MNQENKNKEDAIISEFISFVSHQLKSPLASIKGFSDLLIRGEYGELPDEAIDILKKMKASAERGIDLAYNILDLKKIEDGKMSYHFAEHNIVRLIQGVVDEMMPVANEKDVKLIFNKPNHEVIVRVDRYAFHHVAQNLVDNAIKYSPAGSVEVSVEGKADSVIIIIADSGIGIKKEALQKIFNKFERNLDAEHVIKGTGLGLFIAKNIIEAHGGRIWAESEGLGKGSKFIVELPYKI